MKLNIILIISLLNSNLFAKTTCSDLFLTSQSQNETSRVSTKDATVHSQTEMNQYKRLILELNQLQPSDFLSEEFIRNIENELGEIKISSKGLQNNRKKIGQFLSPIFESDSTTISYNLTVKKSTILTFKLFFSQKNPYEVQINHLRIENPLNLQKNLKAAQDNKGLPIKEFNKVKNKVFETLYKSGYKKVINTGAQNLLVSALYKRMGHMNAIGLFKKYDTLFDYYIKNLFSISELSQSLGDLSKVDYEFFEAEKLYKKTKNSDLINLGFNPIYLNYQIIGYKYITPTKKEKLLIIDPVVKNEKRFIYWSRLYIENSLNLELDLTN